ncbi:ALDH-like protein, partial [Peniophora sp. CONT]
ETLNEYYPGGAASSDSYSRIVSPAHHKRLAELLDSTTGEVTYGGKTGGAAFDGERFIEPTVVTGVSLDDSLMRDEIFGPLLPIIAVEDIDEAIRIVNSRDYPLALYVFARDAKVKEKVFESTQSGSVLANDVMLQVTADGLPFGGIGPSGSGQHTGKFGFDMFTHMRATLDNPSWLDLIMSGRFPPFTDESTKMMRAMMSPSLPPRKPNRWGTSWAVAAVAIAAAVYSGNRLIAARN